VNRQDLDRLLRDLAEVDGSDLHLKSGAPPRRRVNGQLSTLNEPRLTPEDTAELVLAIMPPKWREMFETKQ
jgi:twitching motility protein PilT